MAHKEFYDKFDVGAEKCKDNCTEKVDTALVSINDTDGLRNKIEAAWYYVSYMYKGKDNSSNDAPCHFLYYWIGHELFESPASGNSNVSLQAICSAINDTYQNHKCEIACAPIDKEEFDERKIINDFSYDFSNIKEYLQHYNNNHNTDFNTYIDKVQAATKFMDAKCGGTEGGYCKQFWPNHKDDIQKKLQDLKTELTTAQERIAEATKAAQTAASLAKDEAVRSATTTSSLSSIFGTLVTTTLVPFLLYKVSNKKFQNLKK
ncbi:KIR protein [Plasmodium coatneyi]|uniref:KIR protein n=1 Tax=Plasmodium coatneyi TaxID=208452 RepID=A0A1B1DU04_9APIC|nr:KIR protein [Plasmodium coatneyi]ANQ06260.1 KIR protein [Plasmodium coatneyi]